jgi:SAM-dependent methyltransferase
MMRHVVPLPLRISKWPASCWTFHEDRLRVLQEVRRVLSRDGLFFFSTHSLHAFPFSDAEVQERNRYVDLDLLGQRGWAQLIDYRADVVTYYIYPEVQKRQLEHAGYEVIGALDMKGGEFSFQRPVTDRMVHFLCRCK